MAWSGKGHPDDRSDSQANQATTSGSVPAFGTSSHANPACFYIPVTPAPWAPGPVASAPVAPAPVAPAFGTDSRSNQAPTYVPTAPALTAPAPIAPAFGAGSQGNQATTYGSIPPFGPSYHAIQTLAFRPIASVFGAGSQDNRPPTSGPPPSLGTGSQHNQPPTDGPISVLAPGLPNTQPPSHRPDSGDGFLGISEPRHQIKMVVDNRTPHTLEAQDCFCFSGEFKKGPMTISEWSRMATGYCLAPKDEQIGAAAIVGFRLRTISGETLYLRFLANNPFRTQTFGPSNDSSPSANKTFATFSRDDMPINYLRFHELYYNPQRFTEAAFNGSRLRLTVYIEHGRPAVMATCRVDWIDANGNMTRFEE